VTRPGRGIARHYPPVAMTNCAALGILYAVWRAPLPWWVAESWIAAAAAWIGIAWWRGRVIRKQEMTIRLLQEQSALLEQQLRMERGWRSLMIPGSWN
jgi:hypothetical protein